jgi:dCMP deaminase
MECDDFKYRNEIEAMSRLRNYKVNDLYNESANKDVEEYINRIYNESEFVCKNDNPTVNDIIKENNYLSWDDYFMNIAILASLRSKDSTKVGSVLVFNNKVIGMGYNGFPSGIDESRLPTARVGEIPDVKYSYTIHSEQNCILNSTMYDISGSSIYVTLFPCCHCAALLIQKKISEIVYLSDIHHDDPEYIASRKLLSLTDIKVRQYNGKLVVNA